MKEITYDDLVKANEGLNTTPIERFNKKTGQTDTKQYVDVSQRVKAFRKVYPMGFILPEVVSLENGNCIIKAAVGYYSDNGDKIILATGTAQELQSASIINKTSYIENCETSAVGRALGLAGFGIDSGIASADEMKNALRAQEQAERGSASKAPAKKAPAKQQPQEQLGPDLPISKDAAKKLSLMIAEINKEDQAWWPELKDMYKIEKTLDIRQGDYNGIVQMAQERINVLKGRA